MSGGRKIFIDVGGHEGQTVAFARNPKFAFDEIHTFEPHPDYAARLRAIDDPRVVVHQAALADRAGTLTLVGDNSHGGASVAVGTVLGGGITVPSVDVLPFIDSFGDAARIFLKINCEGGEVAIINRLSSSPRRRSLVSIMVDYDVVKMRFGYWAKRRSIAAARRAGLPLVLSETLNKRNGGLNNWLFAFPEHFTLDAADVPHAQALKRRLRYAMRDARSALGLSVTWRH